MRHWLAGTGAELGRIVADNVAEQHSPFAPNFIVMAFLDDAGMDLYRALTRSRAGASIIRAELDAMTNACASRLCELRQSNSLTDPA